MIVNTFLKYYKCIYDRFLLGYDLYIISKRRFTVNKSSILASVFIFPFLGILVPFLLASQITSIEYTPNIILSSIVILYSSFKLMLFGFKGTKRIIDLAFWLFVYVFLGLASFTQLLTGKFPWVGSSYREFEIFYAYLITIVGLISYDLGQVLTRKKLKKQDAEIDLEEDTEKGGLFILTLPRFYALSLISTILVLFVGLTKLHGNFFISRGEFTGLFGNTTQLLLYSSLFRTPAFVALIIGLVIVFDGRRLIAKSRSFFYPTLFLVFILNVLANNPVANARFWFGTVALAIFFVIFKWRSMSFAIWVNAFIFILIIVFPYSDLFRHSVDSQIVAVKTYKQLSENGDYDAFQQIINTVRYTSYFHLAFGAQFVGAALFFVPRSLWPGKPEGTGAVIANGIGYDYTNLSAPFWSECFINFGMIGVILIFFLYGAAVERIQHVYIHRNRTRKNITLLNIFVPFFAAYQFYFLRGDLLNATANLTCFIIFALLGSKLNKQYLVKYQGRKKTFRESVKETPKTFDPSITFDSLIEKQEEPQEEEKELVHV